MLSSKKNGSVDLREISILITAAGSPSMPGLVKCLRANGERKIRIIGVDMNIDKTIEDFVDKCLLVSPATDISYVDNLLEICKAEKVDILFPGISDELISLSKRMKDFEAIGTIVSVSNQYSLEMCVNKLRLYEFLSNHNIQTPKFYPVHTLEEFEKGVQTIGYPFVLKKAVSTGSRGIRIVDPAHSRADILFNEKPSSFFISYEELHSTLEEVRELPEMLLMEYLPGKEYSVDVLAEKGNVRLICGRYNTVVNSSIPMESILAKDDVAYDYCGKVVQLLDFDGNVNFDFKYSNDGRPILMEINPRIGAGTVADNAGGVNMSYFRIKQLLGEDIPANIEIKYGTRMKRRYLEQFSFEPSFGAFG